MSTYWEDSINPDKAYHPENVAHNARSLNYVRSSAWTRPDDMLGCRHCPKLAPRIDPAAHYSASIITLLPLPLSLSPAIASIAGATAGVMGVSDLQASRRHRHLPGLTRPTRR